MRKYLLFLVFFLTALVAPAADRTVKADSPEITYTGRVMKQANGSVSYDWVGTYLQTAFTGGSVAVDVSEVGTSFHNVFIDGKWMKKIKITGSTPHTVILAMGLRKGLHRLRLQKCTEGQYGRTTIHALRLDKGSKLQAVARSHRLIEVIGDSYTCGYGTEGDRAETHFQLETENCDKAYGCIIARYFDADYVLTAHSGQGLVRDWGDARQHSRKNMTTRYGLLFDDHDSVDYDFRAYRPDLVIVNLGTNDFSPTAIPTAEDYAQAYVNLIQRVRSNYGEVPVLCVTPHSANTYLKAALRVVRDRVLNINKVYMANSLDNTVMYGHDLGNDWHPNYQGQRKIAMSLIPQISAIMGWDLVDGRVVE